MRLSWGVGSKKRPLAVPFSVFSSFAPFQVWVQTLQSLLAPPWAFLFVLSFPSSLLFISASLSPGGKGRHTLGAQWGHPASQVYRTAGGRGSAPGAAGSSMPLLRGLAGGHDLASSKMRVSSRSLSWAFILQSVNPLSGLLTWPRGS